MMQIQTQCFQMRIHFNEVAFNKIISNFDPKICKILLFSLVIEKNSRPWVPHILKTKFAVNSTYRRIMIR